MSRFKGRPMDGLPGRLPAGEQVLWQGAPDWRALARNAFRIRMVAAYFALLVLVRFFIPLAAGHGLAYALNAASYGVALAAASIGMFCVFAWLMARTTTYTVTGKRVVLTYGMALPKSLNLPLGVIEAADLRMNADGSGDIAFKLPAQKRLSYLLLWPHVRAGAQGRSQPVLRCLPAPQHAVQVLAGVLAHSLVAAPVDTAPTKIGSLAQAA